MLLERTFAMMNIGISELIATAALALSSLSLHIARKHSKESIDSEIEAIRIGRAKAAGHRIETAKNLQKEVDKINDFADELVSDHEQKFKIILLELSSSFSSLLASGIKEEERYLTLLTDPDMVFSHQEWRLRMGYLELGDQKRNSDLDNLKKTVRSVSQDLLNSLK